MEHAGHRFDSKKCDALLTPERWQRWDPPRLLALAGARPGQGVLDLGSGPGFWTFPLADIVGPAGQVVALDVSRDLLDALGARHPPAQVRMVQGELPVISLPGASVDFIWAAFVFHEVQPPASLASEMRRVLLPGGRLTVLDWRPDASASDGPPQQDRIPSQQVRSYLLAAGFQHIHEDWRNQDAYLIAAE